jgi:nitrate reductase beta subunit
MKIKAQIGMVLNLDKCIGCHTCSIPCKNVWTNRSGAEYIWFNNVETKPGIGYPKKWENQAIYKGGWEMGSDLRLRAGGPPSKLLKIFHNPDLPAIDEYYEPWTYNYDKLISTPQKKHQPSTRPKSLLTGKPIRLKWGPNWEDDLAGVSKTGLGDVNFNNLDYQIYLQFKKVFMFYLPRLCEHCLNPACVASCPSGALYKREEDGIVLVDQERCRGWRYCVSGCPYKKVYFNWETGRSEKCIFCYPRIEAGMTSLCAETCVGKIRYVGVILYDAEQIATAASTKDEQELYPVQTGIFLDPKDPAVVAEAISQGIPQSYIEAAQHSPVYKLAVDWQLAFPLHPEFRTLPMVWYIPPLSPLAQFFEESDDDVNDPEVMRIPLTYLANLLTAGNKEPVRMALRRLMSLRSYMRSKRLEGKADATVLEKVGMTEEMAEGIYRLLAIAKYKDRFVIPTVKKEEAEDLYRGQGAAGFNLPGA